MTARPVSTSRTASPCAESFTSLCIPYLSLFRRVLYCVATCLSTAKTNPADVGVHPYPNEHWKGFQLQKMVDQAIKVGLRFYGIQAAQIEPSNRLVRHLCKQNIPSSGH
jgi:hypothetical protein